MDLSIVTSLYYSAPHLQEFYTRVCAVAQKVGDDFEIVFVNDGSPDNSFEIALSLFREDERVKVVNLSRNFGHHKALMTGLDHATGDLVFLIDSDLEEEPELLEKFYHELKRTGSDVVFGVQKNRKGNLMERVSGNVFFKIFNLMSPDPIPANHLTARLMKRDYVTALLRHREREFVLSGLWVLTGFDQMPMVLQKHHQSASTYGLNKKISHLVNAITSFSNRPLVLIFYLGCVISLISAIAAIDMIVRKVLFGTLLEGWASLIVSIWFLGGLTIFSLGVIGIYLSKVFIEVKQRPYTIVKDVYHHHAADYEKVELRARDQRPANVAGSS
ncbi:MAG TPA: glycosyltransferase family 2 protein [Pyrinomonadaceae bacterium]|nr:glycosyltransferase family 2 protein [Pyrinomonadaceae bacterium]